MRLLKVSPASMPAVPPQVAAAQDYLRFAEGVRNPPPRFDGMQGAEPHPLSDREQAVYDRALDVLQLYFTGEQDYATVLREDDTPTPPAGAPAPQKCPRCVDGWVCEAHPDRPWPHDDCPGPGMPCSAPGCNALFAGVSGPRMWDSERPLARTFRVGDLVRCRAPGSWCDGRMGTIFVLDTISTDGLRGHAVSIPDSGWTVLNPAELERIEPGPSPQVT